MKLTTEKLLHGAFHAVLLAAIAYLIFGSTRSSEATVALDGATYRVTGPYTHENLGVYFIHGQNQDSNDYLTLEDGLRSGLVKVTEKDQEQVNELMIENTSERPLFLQEGDRIQGGKQDRIIYASHVVSPHSGRMPVASFCVEASRWTAGAAGKNFQGNGNAILAPVSVRTAGKVQKDQGQVWQAVAGQKSIAAAQNLASNTNSSLNETLDAPKVKELSDAFVSALRDKATAHDVIGVAIVVNGQVQEVDLYPNHRLLTKQYPRLLGAYALEAVIQKEQGEETAAPTAAELCAYMFDNEQQAKFEVAAAVRQARQEQQAAQEALQVQGVGQVALQQNDVQLLDNNVRQVQRDRNRLTLSNPNGEMIGILAAPRLYRDESINKDNRLHIVDTGKAYQCATRWNGNVVHKQFLANPAAQMPARAPRAMPPQDQARQEQGVPQRQNVNPQVVPQQPAPQPAPQN
jgi:hypothetical protein